MNTHAEEDGVQCGDLRITAGEKVVGIEIGGVQQQQYNHPTGAAHCVSDAFTNHAAKPGGEAQFFQLVRHHQQRRKPDQRIPGPFLAFHIFPAQYSGK